MIQRYSDAVVIADHLDDLQEFLHESGVPDTAPSLTDDERERLRLALTTLCNTDLNKAGSGGVRQIAGSTHFRLRKTVYSAVVVSVTLAASVASGNPVAMVAAALTAVQQISQLFTQLSNSEILVYRALATIAKHRRAEGLEPHGGTEKEIAELFESEKSALPPNLPQILAALANKQAVKVQFTDDGNTCYLVT